MAADINLNSVISIGNFDGFHLGHQRIIQTNKERADDLHCQSVLFTFRPHPKAFLQPELKLDLITTYDQKISIIKHFNPSLSIFEQPFSREFSNLDASTFFEDYLTKRFHACELVIGFNFQFGKGRTGTIDVLKQLGTQFKIPVTVVDPVLLDGQPVSSSRIRNALKTGNVAFVTEALGRYHFLEGLVIKGDQRGRLIGFPTANLSEPENMVPSNGVYETKTQILDDRFAGPETHFRSITNIGLRPTFQDLKPKTTIETHLVGQNLDLYGKKTRVHFVRKIRDEKKFDSITSLTDQIRADVLSLST